jgi:putative oxidoreductase
MNGGVMLAILRIVSGLLLLEHGTQKFLGFPGGPMAGMGRALNSWPAYAGIIELVCGLLIAIGLFTRPAAFLAAGMTAVAYWFWHAPNNFFPINNGGETAILYCFIFLYLVFAGAGPLSVDAARAGRADKAPPQA